MRLTNKPGFTNWAIIVVSILIGLTLLAIGVLGYEIAQRESILPWLDPEAERPSPMVTSTPVAPPALATSTKVLVTPPSISAPATNILPHSTPTAGMSEAVLSETPANYLPAVETPAPSKQQMPVLLSAHPTYQPTTQPCENCHSDIRGGGVR